MKNFELSGVINDDSDEDTIQIKDFKNAILKNQIHSKLLLILITNN